MIGPTQYITRRVNRQPWKLQEDLGSGFENKLYDVLVREMEPYFDLGARIHLTPRSRDDGKDIVILSPVPLKVLHNSFEMRGKLEIVIFIECKSSDTGQIRSLLGNVSVEDSQKDIDYFALVSNTYITPHTHFHMYDKMKGFGVEFVIVDQYLLAQYLALQHAMFGEYSPLDFTPGIEGEYQYQKGIEDGQKTYQLFMSFRNYTDQPHHFSLYLLTDRNWKVDEPVYEVILSPRGNVAKKLIVSREYTDGINDLVFQIKMGEHESQVHIQGYDLEQRFETPFMGEKQIRLKETVKQQLVGKGPLFYLYGDAGMGKTRLVQEIYNSLSGRNFNIGFFTLGRQDLVAHIKNFLVNNRYEVDPGEDVGLSRLLKSCRNEFRHAILIIDDLHNAKKSLLEEIRLLADGMDAPISLILCGRTDYSAGNADYFSFTQWAIESPQVHAYKIEPLDRKDTENLIRSIINHVPSVVLETLTERSQNNPLYITQYIEYMLETDLVALESRHTVGILNIESFTSHNYMPDTVEKIYKARWKNLMSLPEAVGMRDLMFFCVVNHGAVTSDQLIFFLGETMGSLQILLERRFFRLREDGNYGFIHESLFLFVSHVLDTEKKLQKHIAERLIRNEIVFDGFSLLDRGLIALWSGELAEAFQYFEPTVDYLRAIENHSSINIDIEIYDYLYPIFSLLSKDEEDLYTLKNIIYTRVYIALHYYSPRIAIEECDKVLQLLKGSLLEADQPLRNMLIEHQAHSYINAGDLVNGEMLLKQLQAWWLTQPDGLDGKTVFDMYDKFCNIYIKQNCFDLADWYNQLSERQAINEKDDNLLALSYISRAKLHFYCDPVLAKEYIEKAGEILRTGISRRIECHNEITRLVFRCVYEPADWKEIKKEADILLKQAVENSFGNSVVRAYMLLAVASLMDRDEPSLNCKQYIDKGIDASIRFGIGTYTWQLYNLLAILYEREKYQANEVSQVFSSVFALLNRQNLLYLGRCDFCYGNLLAISNVAFFWQRYKGESYFYKQTSGISYINSTPACDYDCAKPSCGYLCSNATDFLKGQYQRARDKQVLFYDKKHTYHFAEETTGYFIIIS